MRQVTTRAGVEATAGRLARAARTVGLLEGGASLALSPGSVANGIAWTLTTAEEPGRNFLGLDLGRRGVDARQRMHAAAQALEAVVEHLAERSRLGALCDAVAGSAMPCACDGDQP